MKRLLLLALAAGSLAFQEPQPIPDYPGDGNSQHDGQPAFCTNVTGKYKANCQCKSMNENHECEGGGESSKCSVYCRKSDCKCKSECDTR